MRKAFCSAGLFYSLLVISLSVNAQRPKIKYGDVSIKDFESKAYSIDSSAHAVVLASFGEVEYEGNSNGALSIVYKKHVRIRIMNKNGFDAGTISIPLYTGNSSTTEEKVERLEAQTFNLVNGKVEGMKLDSKSIFKDKLRKNLNVQKFTMPNLQEGCIIDVKYNVISPFPTSIDGWEFQGEYPTLWSEYVVSTPALYDFARLMQGYQKFAVNTVSTSTQLFNILDPGEASQSSSLIRYTAKVVTTTMAMENVPALKREDFTTTIKNHIAKVSFQVSRINPPNGVSRSLMNTWYKASEDLMKNPDFGEELTGNLGWLKSELKTIVGNAASEQDKAKAIYNFVKKNFTCSNHSSMWKSSSLKKTFQNKSGNVADINLLLTAMLLAEGFDAKPVILSTRDHGVTYDAYPIMERMNYVISKLELQGQRYLLDASYSKLGFALLPLECYNGSARIIGPEPFIIRLSADSLHETKVTHYIMMNDGTGKLKGSIASTFGPQESYQIREQLATSSKTDYMDRIKKTYPADMKISDVAFDSLDIYEEPLAVKYNLEMSFDEDVVYINPLFSEAQSDNPFKAAERLYPVEMPYALNEVVVSTIYVPEGYTVDEIPKSARVKYNEDEGMFEYILVKNGDMIQVRSIVKLNKATFLPEDYTSLRDFFAYVVKRHSEPVVLKKIKK